MNEVYVQLIEKLGVEGFQRLLSAVAERGDATLGATMAVSDIVGDVLDDGIDKTRVRKGLELAQQLSLIELVGQTITLGDGIVDWVSKYQGEGRAWALRWLLAQNEYFPADQVGDPPAEVPVPGQAVAEIQPSTMPEEMLVPSANASLPANLQEDSSELDDTVPNKRIMLETEKLAQAETPESTIDEMTATEPELVFPSNGDIQVNEEVTAQMVAPEAQDMAQTEPIPNSNTLVSEQESEPFNITSTGAANEMDEDVEILTGTEHLEAEVAATNPTHDITKPASESVASVPNRFDPKSAWNKVKQMTKRTSSEAVASENNIREAQADQSNASQQPAPTTISADSTQANGNTSSGGFKRVPPGKAVAKGWNRQTPSSTDTEQPAEDEKVKDESRSGFGAKATPDPRPAKSEIGMSSEGNSSFRRRDIAPKASNTDKASKMDKWKSASPTDSEESENTAPTKSAKKTGSGVPAGRPDAFRRPGMNAGKGVGRAASPSDRSDKTKSGGNMGAFLQRRNAAQGKASGGDTQDLMDFLKEQGISDMTLSPKLLLALSDELNRRAKALRDAGLEDDPATSIDVGAILEQIKRDLDKEKK